jgi:serine/threonine protein kinase
MASTTTNSGDPPGEELPPCELREEAEALIARLADDMAACWRRGDFRRAEHYLDLHSHLRNVPAAVMDLLYEELTLCGEYGQRVDQREVLQRFPEFEGQVRILFDCLSALEAGPAPQYPEAGETLGDFYLLSVLGQGAQGRVFLAVQRSLADRPVVLKTSPRRGDEHLSLARLQHTHVVPLLSVTDDHARHLRVLCMPYFGGLTLAAILDQLQRREMSQRTGRHLLEILDAERAAAPMSLPPGRDPATPFLQRASYVQAISWIGACLAEALKYAHERGLVHLDLKPSNVLLTADRQPMLLDFHLAREPLRPGDSDIRFGGTPAYMSPEQKRAMIAIREGRLAREAIDGRSDIWSLGLVLYEALGGPLPGHSTGALTPLRKFSAQVTPGLSDIIGRCLSPRPEDRYPDAGRLAADLWAHLNDAPLKGVRNRSLAERWSKWRRRRPHFLSMVALCAVVVLLAGAALVSTGLYVRHRVEEAATALADGKQLLARQQHAEASNTFKRGLSGLESLPGNAELKQQLAGQLRLAVRLQAAAELHEIADRCRFLYGADYLPAALLVSVETRCRALWEQRETILDRLGIELEPSVEQRVRIDLLDLAILGADLRVRVAPKSQVAAARREALRMLDQAEEFAGPSAVLYQERQRHAGALGLTSVANEAQRKAAGCPPRGPWEHYALGRALMSANQLENAAVHFDRAAAVQSDRLWASFYKGICCHRLRRFDDAALAFTVCTTLAPTVAGCFYNRALALLETGRTDLATRDLDQALELDPGLVESPLANRLRDHRNKLPPENSKKN